MARGRVAAVLRGTRRMAWHLVCAMLAGALGAPALSAQAESPGDPEARAFSAVVEALRSEAEGILLVEPRPVVRGADLTSVEAGELSSASAGRRQVLERAGLGAADFLQEQRCLFAHGLPVPPEVAPAVPDSIAAAREACRARPRFTAAVVGLPCPARGGGAGEVVVPVAWMTTSRYVVQHFHLRSGRAGTLEVVRVETVADVMS